MTGTFFSLIVLFGCWLAGQANTGHVIVTTSIALPECSVQFRRCDLLDSQFSTPPIRLQKLQPRTDQQKQVDQLDGRFGIGAERDRSLWNIAIYGGLGGICSHVTSISRAFTPATLATRRLSGSARVRPRTRRRGTDACCIFGLLVEDIRQTVLQDVFEKKGYAKDFTIYNVSIERKHNSYVFEVKSESSKCLFDIIDTKHRKSQDTTTFVCDRPKTSYP